MKKDRNIMTPEERLNQIQEGNRRRSLKYLASQRAKGKTPLTIMLSDEAYQEVCKRKEASMAADEALTISDIINKALVDAREFEHLKKIEETRAKERQAQNALNNQPQNQNVENLPYSEKGTSRDIAAAEPPPDRLSAPDKYRTWLYGQIEALRRQGNSYIQIADMFNQKNVVGMAGKELSNKGIEAFYNKHKKG